MKKPKYPFLDSKDIHRTNTLWIENNRVFALWTQKDTITILNENKEIDKWYLDKSKFWDIFRDKEVVFHWIRFDKIELNWIESFLKEWILNKESLKDKWIKENLPIWYNWNFHISVSRPPTENYYWVWWEYSSFLMYIRWKNFIWFVIKNEWLETRTRWDSFNLKSEFYDEWFVRWNIDSKKIKGIIIDEDLLTKKVNWDEKLWIFLFQNLKEKYWIKIYNKKWFEINI